jgi:protein-L-isoaspartate(D-aspartate) O-methyltransferase
MISSIQQLCLIFTVITFLFWNFPKMKTSGVDLFRVLRSKMVDTQIRARGVTDPRVLTAMNTVPRQLFVPNDFIEGAYDESPQPIGYDQTISQPFMVAYMAEAAEIGPNDKVLEIGTGCGYAAAVLSHLGKEVYTMETIPGLAREAKFRLHNLGYSNVHCFTSDGSIGLEDHAPYDVIIVAAAAPSVPASLTKQLAVKGRLIIPVAVNNFMDELVRVTKDEENEIHRQHLMEVRFVPLIGKEGFRDDDF